MLHEWWITGDRSNLSLDENNLVKVFSLFCVKIKEGKHHWISAQTLYSDVRQRKYQTEPCDFYSISMADWMNVSNSRRLVPLSLRETSIPTTTTGVSMQHTLVHLRLHPMTTSLSISVRATVVIRSMLRLNLLPKPQFTNLPRLVRLNLRQRMALERHLNWVSINEECLELTHRRAWNLEMSAAEYREQLKAQGARKRDPRQEQPMSMKQKHEVIDRL